MFDILSFLEEKREGISHKSEDIEFFVNEFHKGKIPDYQVSAWLTSVFHKGMSQQEIKSFTLALAHSGDIVPFPRGFNAVDKHSTGGVGDKTTLIVVPLVAASGLPVAKLSGRGLGFTGGTVDKLESIPNMNVHLSTETFLKQVERIGCAISGHSMELAPAEGKFYALRDVTATVPSLPLICSSIVSKKMAGGASKFVFDVKCGQGAFMQTFPEARALAQALVSLSASLNHPSMAIISAMDQPLGEWIGNSMEVYEAIKTLQGEGPSDTELLSLHLAGAMIVLGGKATSLEEGVAIAHENLVNGQALQKMEDLIEAQEGEKKVCISPEKYLRPAKEKYTLYASKSGFLAELNARKIGEGVKRIGGGRTEQGDHIDLSVSVHLRAKQGDFVEKGNPIFDVYYTDNKKLQRAKPFFERSIHLVDIKPSIQNLIMEIVS
ncbi:MAG: thymidine phosphorylase [Aminobacterium sp.]|jgi:pyrimidine-nucleoside phosphorylase|uniref:thymidine phosphorylase n=1 Tax=unclassified Aminobacterium TaxID=2685012 RepID=UPI001BCB41D0|nr:MULTISPECIES: thymidine phosphorylase [unclassified Aminobacterium]MDD2205869.1 thymidine phosphorylase [Aminobacterium sp.]MDD3706682.1 thymidine phosphorylase [Aminobacterium sp.]MDD4228116.1 thymidine phosphorylase [Aminobacterium sp.]MDD4550861.1 thymidine phosphorylase [Aminobacterium sp.]MEA4876913.1 thymidine phosphorylase [Aminobacterium sp.]